MVRHQAMGEKLQGVRPRLGLCEDALKGGVVAVFFEEGQPHDASVEDVVDQPGFADARRSRHGEHGSERLPEGQENLPDTFDFPASNCPRQIELRDKWRLLWLNLNSIVSGPPRGSMGSYGDTTFYLSSVDLQRIYSQYGAPVITCERIRDCLNKKRIVEGRTERCCPKEFSCSVDEIYSYVPLIPIDPDFRDETTSLQSP